MVKCTQCKAENPDDKRFCSDCGGPLDPASAAVKGLVETTLREKVGEFLKERYKDQKLVEIETTQAIAVRLSDWAKLLGFFIGIPLALLFFLLGFFGVTKYSEFSTLVTSSQKSIETHLAETQKGAEKLRKDAETLAADYEKLKLRLADSETLAAQVETLSRKVDAISDKLGFTATSKISPEIKAQLEAAFDKFKKHLQGLGYKGTNARVEIDIPEKINIGMIAYYEPTKQRMVIESRYAGDPVILYREYMHHVLHSSGAPSGQSDALWPYYAIESALAWYVPCSFINDPAPARTATSWDLTKKRSFRELRPDLAAATVDGTEIWGAAFWAMRQKLTPEVADKLLLDTWFKLRPDELRVDRGANFVRKLLDADKTHQAQIREIFVERGLPL